MTVYGYAAYGYIALISLVSVIVCAADKRRSKIEGAKRVSEFTLIALAMCGGSVAMLVTMLLIRHKTRKVKFMLGLPVIIILQYALIWAVFDFILNRRFV